MVVTQNITKVRVKNHQVHARIRLDVDLGEISTPCCNNAPAVNHIASLKLISGDSLSGATRETTK